MKIKTFGLQFCLFAMSLLMCSCTTQVINKENAGEFINEMVTKHQFDRASLTEVFSKVSINDDILKKISTPSESLPWYKYRKIFLTKKRIAEGVEFWRTHKETLTTVEQKYGVPASMIVAILGVETFYGKHTGNYQVLLALSTLAFAYPPRAHFFRSELENFLFLCRDEKIDPLTPLGSYAGAMGMPQFMPSSYLNYAVDFNQDKKRDIWKNADDTIASIANYFAEHGWQKNQPVIVKIRDVDHKTAITPGSLKENLRILKVESVNPKKRKPLLLTQKAQKIAFQLENGEELWAPFDNFYVITRYNKSPLYALAAYQLSLAISNQIINFSYEQTHNDFHASAFERLLE